MLDKVFVTLYCIIILLVPESLNLVGVTYSKLLLIMTLGLLFYKILYKKEKIKFQKNFLSYFSISLIIFSCWTFAVNVFYLFVNKQFILSNFFEVLRPILYVSTILLVNIYSRSDEIKKYLKKLFIILVVVNCIVAISQRYNPFNINELYVKFIAPTQYHTLVGNYPDPRVVGLTGNPNVFGLLLSIGILVTTYEIIVSKKKKYLILFLLEYITLFMTMSRTSFVCNIFMLMIFIFAYYFKSKGFKKTIVPVLTLVVFCFSSLFILPDKITWRIKQLIDISGLTSWISRVEHSSDNFHEIFSPEPIEPSKPDSDKEENEYLDVQVSRELKIMIGVGSDKLKQYGLVYDNEYLVIIYRYGIIGLVIYLLIYLLPLLKLNQQKDGIFALFISLFLGALIYMYPAAIYHSYKLFIVLCFVLALYFEEKNYPKNKKNVLMISTYFPPFGGVGVFRVTKFVKYLKRKKYNPIVVTVDDKLVVNEDKSLLKDINDCDVYRLEFKSSRKLAKDFYYALKELIEPIIAKNEPSVVFVTGGPFYVLPIGRYLYDKYQIPYIIDLRDPWSFQKNNGGIKAKIITIKNKIFEKYTFSKASYICCVNETMTDEYKKLYPKYESKFVTITNGYDEEDFEKIIPIKFKQFSIVYTGKFEVSAGFRDPSIVFKVIKNLRNEGINIKFIHVGNRENRVVELAKKYGIFENCEFVGFKSYEESLSYCKGADIQILITGNEKSEMITKIFDYMGCKNPIIAITNKDNELYKICKNNQSIYVVGHNETKKLKEIILKIKNNNIKPIVNNGFTREMLTEQLIKLIEKVNKEQ